MTTKTPKKPKVATVTEAPAVVTHTVKVQTSAANVDEHKFDDFMKAVKFALAVKKAESVRIYDTADVVLWEQTDVAR